MTRPSIENSPDFDPATFKFPEQQSSSVPEKPSRLKEQLRKAILKTAAFSMMFGSHMVGYGQTRSTETRARFAPAAVEKVETRKKTFTVPEIRQGLRTDPAERIFMATDAGDPEQLYEISGGGASSGFLSYDELERMLAREGHKTSKLKVIHTHPAEAYRSVFLDADISAPQFEEYRSGAKELPPHPPSMADFISQGNLQRRFGLKKITVTSEVIDATGVWDYQVDENSILLTDLARAQREYSATLDQNLTEKQWSIMTATMESGQVDPRMLGTYLSGLPESQDPSGAKVKLGRTIIRLEAQVYSKYKKDTDTYREIEKLGAAVILAKSAEEREAAEAAYKNLCEQNGIHVSYNPATK